ncbi:hypothetical protein D3C87_1339860 [compost metagenome]
MCMLAAKVAQVKRGLKRLLLSCFINYYKNQLAFLFSATLVTSAYSTSAASRHSYNFANHSATPKACLAGLDTKRKRLSTTATHVRLVKRSGTTSNLSIWLLTALLHLRPRLYVSRQFLASSYRLLLLSISFTLWFVRSPRVLT